MDDLAVERIQRGNDVVAGFARGSGSVPSGPGSPMREDGAPRAIFGRRRTDRSLQMASRVARRANPISRAASQHRRDRFPTARASCETSLPSVSPKPPGLHEIALHVDDQQRRGRPVRDRSARAPRRGCRWTSALDSRHDLKRPPRERTARNGTKHAGPCHWYNAAAHREVAKSIMFSNR